MGLRINTNIAAEYANYNLQQTNNKLNQSLNRLSTGLRITKAADDAAGMTIADGLKFQSMNLGQAINNGNNAIKLIQIADMALQKSIDIVQTVAQKATQAANATEDKSSREAIQAEINKLIEEVNNIANTTSYKDTKLLNGSFLGKMVHIGAYMDQTISIGALSTKADAIGRVADHVVSNAVNLGYSTASAVSSGAITYNSNIKRAIYTNDVLQINDVKVGSRISGVDEDRQISAKTMAAAINSVQDMTGVQAQAETVVSGANPVSAGTIQDGGLIINGINIGYVEVGAGDGNQALVNAINKYSDQTGVIASVDDSGKLILTAQDGRNIAVEVSDNAAKITGLSTKITSATGATDTSALAGAKLYIDGVSVAISANEGAASVASAINYQLKQAGIDIDTQIRASTTADGHINIKVLDGRDLNATVSAADAATAASIASNFFGLHSYATGTNDVYYIANDSNHGKIELISDKDIYVTTFKNEDKAVGFKSQKLGLNNTLQDVDVTTQKGAELAIKIAQTALSNLDAVRSNLGAIQNQIQATVENISVTQINIDGAESTIRDVNFAKESSTFSKLQILAQSGTYALAQANAVQQNVLRLLQ